MEAAHTASTLRAAARLATTELLSSGTTAVLTMETVHDFLPVRVDRAQISAEARTAARDLAVRAGI